MHRKILASSHQHLMAEAPRIEVGATAAQRASTFWSRCGPGLLDVHLSSGLDPGLHPGACHAVSGRCFPRAYRGTPSCPKIRTNSRPASAGAFRIDASRLCSRSPLTSPAPIRIRMLSSDCHWPSRASKAPISKYPVALLHGPEQIADLPVSVGESPGAVSIGHAERGHLVEYLAPNSVFNSLPRQRSSPHLGPHDRLVTIDRVLHHASLGAA